MILRITNKCTMGCSHCFIDNASPTGSHMDESTFIECLCFAKKCQAKSLIISGGEPFEHPKLFDFLRLAMNAGFPAIIVATNGTFASNENLYNQATNPEFNNVMFQVTNDSRFYPQNVNSIKSKFEGKKWFFIQRIQKIHRCNRTEKNKIITDPPTSTCCNIRSIFNEVKKLDVAIQILENVLQKFCKPSINTDGSIAVGEKDTCFKIGHVSDDIERIEAMLHAMQCDNCNISIQESRRYHAK